MKQIRLITASASMRSDAICTRFRWPAADYSREDQYRHRDCETCHYAGAGDEKPERYHERIVLLITL